MNTLAAACRLNMIGVLGVALSACSAETSVGTGTLMPTFQSDRSIKVAKGLVQPNGAPTTAPMTSGLLYFLFVDSVPDYLRLQTPGDLNNNFGSNHSVAIATDNRLRVYDAYDGLQGNPSGVEVFDHQNKFIKSFSFADPPNSMALDAHHSVYLGAADLTTGLYNIDVFSSDASGTVTPSYRLGGAKTQIVYPRALAVDANGTLYVANTANDGTVPNLQNASPPYDILIFANDARGNTPPIRIIDGDQTGLTQPLSLALGADGNLYVANQTDTGFDVLVFPTSDNGNVPPIRTLQSTPYGSSVALGANGEMILGGGNDNPGHSCFAVYAPGASGSDVPESYPEEKFENKYNNYCGANEYIFDIALQHPWYQP